MIHPFMRVREAALENPRGSDIREVHHIQVWDRIHKETSGEELEEVPPVPQEGLGHPNILRADPL